MHSVNETKAPLEYDVDGFRSHSELENEWEGRLLLLRQNIDISLLLLRGFYHVKSFEYI